MILTAFAFLLDLFIMSLILLIVYLSGGSLTGSSGSGSGTGALSGLSGRISGHKSALAQPQPTIDMLVSL